MKPMTFIFYLPLTLAINLESLQNLYNIHKQSKQLELMLKVTTLDTVKTCTSKLLWQPAAKEIRLC